MVKRLWSWIHFQQGWGEKVTEEKEKCTVWNISLKRFGINLPSLVRSASLESGCGCTWSVRCQLHKKQLRTEAGRQ